jgi:cohesin loading factor subunit SCC2
MELLGRLRGFIKQSEEQLKQLTVLRPLLLIMPIVALLTQHCDFDKLRQEQPSGYCKDS